MIPAFRQKFGHKISRRRQDIHNTKSRTAYNEDRKYVRTCSIYVTSLIATPEPKSKRVPVRLRNKIEKASAAKQRKARKQAKKVCMPRNLLERGLTKF